MCADMIDLKKARTRIKELEEELKATREDYEEEIEELVEKNDDLIKKIGIFMGGPTPVDEDEEPKEISPEDYIIIDGTDSEADSSDDDYVDEASRYYGVNDRRIFLIDHLISSSSPPCKYSSPSTFAIDRSIVCPCLID